MTSDARANPRQGDAVTMAGIGAALIGALWMLHRARLTLVLVLAGSLPFARLADGLTSPPHTTVFALAVATCLGLLLGARHACEPDHLIALSTLVTQEDTPARAARLGVSWGVGHAAALLVIGTGLAALQRNLPPRLTETFEIGVAIMLTALGIRALMLSARHGLDGPSLARSHGALTHHPPGKMGHIHIGSWTLSPRPLLVGAVHGLAGSGALTALVMANLPTMFARLCYITLFAAGSTVGMAALSASAGWPVARLVRQPMAMTALYAVSGVLAITYGVITGSPIIHRWWSY